MRSMKGQTTIEMIVVVGLIMILFTLTLIVAHTKSLESNDFKRQLDAKRVVQSITDNINTIAEQGHGYYRYFTLPPYLFGWSEYNISVYGSFVEICFEDRYGEKCHTTQIITSSVSKYCLDKGGANLNKVFNYNEKILVTCNRADLMFVEDSFELGTTANSVPIPVNIDLLNYGVLSAAPFNVTFNLINQSGGVIWGPESFRIIGGLGADAKININATIPPRQTGSYNLSVGIDTIANEINESYKGDNWYNATFIIT